MIILVAKGRGRGRGRGRGTRGGARDAGSSSSSDLRRSNRVKEKDHSYSAEEEVEEEVKEEVLASSQQIAFQPSSASSQQIAFQPSSALPQQSLSQQSSSQQSLPQQSSSQQSSSQQSLSQQSSSQQSLPQRSLSQEPFSLNVNLPSLQSNVNNPPLIIDPTERDIIIRSRSHTPVMDAKSMNTMSEIMSPTATQQSRRSTPSVEVPVPSRVPSDDRLGNIETMMIKHGKQNRIIYEMQKTTLEKISSLQTQIKKINSDKSNELSPKVFNVSNNLVCIILSH